MIGVSKLLLGATSESDGLRYISEEDSGPEQIKYHRENVKSNKPIVVWNMTKHCNLKCIHCYATATSKPEEGELSTDEGKKFLEDIARYDCPVVLFSGGEPLLREDLFELAEYADSLGLRPVISTNGTLITEEKAKLAKKAGIKYIGVSLDGLAQINDKFRGVNGAFNDAIRGMKNSLKADIKTGLRFTITKHNQNDLSGVLLKLKEIGVNRCCVYHLDYTGRGKGIAKYDLTPGESRKAVSTFFELTKKHHADGFPIETLLVGNYCDGGFLYLKLLKENPERAKWAYDLLKINGGDGTGETIADVDYKGFVHANQFWQNYSFGNIRERYFGDIWEDTSDPIMKGLKNKAAYIKGRCAASSCRFFEICKGGSRVRSLALTGDVWASDPACYLTDEEIKK
ncbi:MAG: radical SAM protein [Thermoplasmatales archaeon]|nr:MAG: radical SAM protein [Thermoplasmatales archaeon]